MTVVGVNKGSGFRGIHTGFQGSMLNRKQRAIARVNKGTHSITTVNELGTGNGTRDKTKRHNKPQRAQTRKPTSAAPSTSRQEDGATTAPQPTRTRGPRNQNGGNQTNTHLFLTHKERDTHRQLSTNNP
jgi:hypothetical protein